jgi:hypothetical protein
MMKMRGKRTRWLPGPVLGPEKKLMPSVQESAVTHWTSCVSGSRNIYSEDDREVELFLRCPTYRPRPLPFDFTRRSV